MGCISSGFFDYRFDVDKYKPFKRLADGTGDLSTIFASSKVFPSQRLESGLRTKSGVRMNRFGR
jgi:hypothetical protein